MLRSNDKEQSGPPRFMETVAQWIAASDEVLVILRYLRSAGARDYVLCPSFGEFQGIVDRCPLGTDIIVFRERTLPLRGIVTEHFIEQALAALSDDEEYLIVDLGPIKDYWWQKTGTMGQSHADLREDLLDWLGKEVALGLLPDYTVTDHKGMIYASKGGINGPR